MRRCCTLLHGQHTGKNTGEKLLEEDRSGLLFPEESTGQNDTAPNIRGSSPLVGGLRPADRTSL